LFIIRVGRDKVRASRFTSNFGAKVTICEMSFATTSFDNVRGFGGTCFVHGFLPKHLLFILPIFFTSLKRVEALVSLMNKSRNMIQTLWYLIKIHRLED
jgi:hypothetical protein